MSALVEKSQGSPTYIPHTSCFRPPSPFSNSRQVAVRLSLGIPRLRPRALRTPVNKTPTMALSAADLQVMLLLYIDMPYTPFLHGSAVEEA